MPESRDPRSIIEAAEQAAAAGNHAAAVELLREAASLQQATLGPLHLDLANTLNNLAVMCELTDNPVDAEHNFRRAVAIATAALPPDHPFVTTSRENLREFCEARAKPVELPSPSPLVPAKPEPQVPAPVNPPLEARPSAESAGSKPLVRRRSVRPLEIGGPITVVLLLIMILAGHQWLSTTDGTKASSAAASAPAPEVPTTPEPGSDKPIPAPKETTKAVASAAGAGRSTRVTADATSVRPTVVRARLCAELDDWLCDPPDRPVPHGPLFFYTQVKSASATTIQHRWYRGDRLYKSEELRIQVRPSGDRTFSRYVLDGESAGSWRIEVRAEDGGLLHEERFSAR